jgi:hypothetical protein
MNFRVQRSSPFCTENEDNAYLAAYEFFDQYFFSGGMRPHRASEPLPRACIPGPRR